MTAYINIYHVILWEHNFPKIIELCLNPLVKWALPFHNCITCCMTTPQKLACWLLHSDAACAWSGLLQTSRGSKYCKYCKYSVAPIGKLDICSSHVAHVAWQMWCQCQPPRLPYHAYLECPKSNAQRHGLLATVKSCQQLARSSLSNTDCLRPFLCDVTAVFSRNVPQQRSEWKPCDGMVE